jgi:hypothetical protein
MSELREPLLVVTPEMVKGAIGKFGADLPWCRTVAERLNVRLAAAPTEDLFSLIKAVHDGFTPDPGTSDLDNEQPITVRMSLGEYRRAERLYYELRKI